MKRLFVHILLFLALAPLWSQQEECRILTDRSLYVAGEDINFSVYYRGPGGMAVPEGSQVFYLELISPAGEAWSRAKIRMDSMHTGGHIDVPRDMPSGTYFLKGYTRWMRNFGPAAYNYLSVDVVNPYVRTVLRSDTLSEFTVSLLPGGGKKAGTGPVIASKPGVQEKRSPMQLELNSPALDVPLECCISIIPAGSLEKQWESVPASGTVSEKSRELLPETRGIAISGTVEADSTGKPVPFAIVYVSIMGEKKDFFCNYSDSAGRFYFTLPGSYQGRELFISSYHAERGNLQVVIDQDFCKEPVKLPSFPFRIPEGREEVVRNMVINAQISEQYSSPGKDKDSSDPAVRGWFYGEPGSVIHFDDFIRLPTMEEYFTEVTPQVAIKRNGGRRSFRVLGDHHDLRFYDPLIMVDGVAVFDTEAVLAISPGYIDRFEIVEDPFVRGNLTFGGIIHLISRKGDMGYIDLPSSGLLVNYSMYTTASSGNTAYRPADPRIPDARNTLYWNPGIRMNPSEELSISLYSPEVPGTYDVVIRGYDPEGRYFESRTPFTLE